VTTNLSKLNIIPLKRPTKQSPAEHRRSNLVAKLTEQMELAKAQAEGKPFVVIKNGWSRDDAGNKQRVQKEKVVRAWWWNDGPALSLVIRYGARPIELSKGKRAITVANLGEIPATINTVIAAVRAGELDSAMEAVVAAGKAKAPRN
jgi:hypothetical protein